MFSMALVTASILTTAINTAPPAVGSALDDQTLEPQATFTYRQPWTRPSAAFESRVFDCGAPRPSDLAAMDDFRPRRDGDLVGMRWWGVLLNGAQIGHPYYIAIYSDVDCQPGDLLYETCLVPQTRPVGIDCLNQRVFEFRTPMPAFGVEAGKRYWLQISEADALSAQPGVNDFLWSGHQPVVGCRALQTPDYVTYRPLTDPCNQRTSDLAFDLLFRN